MNTIPTTNLNGPQTLLNMHHSPSPYEFAVLAKHAYRNAKVGDVVSLQEDNVFKGDRTLNDWKVLKIFKEERKLSATFKKLGLPFGYRGTLYINETKKQLVLAHRGTDFKNISAVKTDILSIAKNFIGGQETLLPDLLADAVNEAKSRGYTLSTTGHSLGGWLAQVTAFLAKDLYPNFHVKCVAFDTPGAKPMLEQINARISPIDLTTLDITNYLSSPNLVNCCNTHLECTVQRVVWKAFPKRPGVYSLNSHSSSNFINAFDPKTGEAKKSVLVRDWPVLSTKNLTNIVTPNKVKAVFYTFLLMYKCAKKESLGEFSGFFNFANQMNDYHMEVQFLTGKNAFLLPNKYHYRTQPFNKTWTHIRHLSDPSYQFFRGIEKNSPKHIQAIRGKKPLESLTFDGKTTFSLPKGDIRIAIDQLFRLTIQLPLLTKPQSFRASSKKELLITLPPKLPFFVGRKKELDEVEKIIKAKKNAPTITGPGGIGKSLFALRLADQLNATEHYDYIALINAESEEAITDSYLRIGKRSEGVSSS